MPLRKSLRRKVVSVWTGFYAEVPYSGAEGKHHKGHFSSKEEKQTPRFKIGRDRLTLLFCANADVFMIRTALSIKLLTPDTWREKMTAASFLVVQQGSRGHKNPFSEFSVNAFPLKSGSNLASKGTAVYKVLLILDKGPWPPRTPLVQHQRLWSGLFVLKHNVSNSASRSGRHKDLEGL